MFGRRKREEDLAAAIARRGVGARAEVADVRATGATRGSGAREIELTLAFTTHDGAPTRAVVRQWFDDVTAEGIAPGAAAEIMYDATDPARVVVLGPAR
jgi:hypothetical protein